MHYPNPLHTHNYLGYAWGDKDSPRFLSLEDRCRHVLLTGAPGSGKSTMLANLFAQEANNGRGVMLIDDHGDLYRQATTLVPPPRRRKTICLDASDRDCPVGFNPLYNVAKVHQPTRVADMVKAFKSIWADSWGPRLNHILLFSLSALIEQGDATLLSITPMLLDSRYRERVLANVTDVKTLQFWRDTYPLYIEQGAETLTPILNKVDALLSSPQVRNILCNPKSAFDPRHIIDNRYILIVNLSGIGSEPANLLGSLLISSIASAAWSREDVLPGDRLPFTLIIDEFTNYTTSEFRTLLSAARKYNLSLVLAHQYLDQMRDDAVKQAALGTVGTFIVFRVSGADAETFARGPLSEYPPERYTETTNFRAWCRLLQYGSLSQTFELHCLPAPKPHKNPHKTVEHSRHQFGTPRRKIEQIIERFLAPSSKPPLSPARRKWSRR